MLLFFFAFIACGFIQEFSDLTGRKNIPLTVQTIYLIGTIVFLIVERDYVLSGFIELLLLVSLISNLLELFNEHNELYRKVDAAICLGAILALAFHAIIYLIKTPLYFYQM